MWVTMRTRAGSLVLLLGSLALGGCSDGAAVAIPAEGPWTIASSSEGGIGAALACLDDEAVTDGLQSADMPASSGSRSGPERGGCAACCRLREAPGSRCRYLGDIASFVVSSPFVEVAEESSVASGEHADCSRRAGRHPRRPAQFRDDAVRRRKGSTHSARPVQ